jgi:hypothetical protein
LRLAGECAGQHCRIACDQTINRKLRIGADAGWEDRAIMNRQIADLEVASTVVYDTVFGSVSHGATTHDVGADHTTEQRGEGQLGEAFFGCRPAGVAAACFMDRCYP